MVPSRVSCPEPAYLYSAPFSNLPLLSFPQAHPQHSKPFEPFVDFHFVADIAHFTVEHILEHVQVLSGLPRMLFGSDALGDPNGPTRKTRDRLNNQQHQVWGGPLLGPNGSVTINGNVISMGAFAEGVFADLEFVLGPRDRELFLLSNKRLDVDAKRRLKHGMRTGGTKIRDHLRGLAE